MQRLHELRQYLIDLNTIPRLCREEVHSLISQLAAARQGRLSPEQTAQVKQRLIEGHLCSRAHVGRRGAAAFLKDYRPVIRPRPASKAKSKPTKASPQERLQTAYTLLVARGEKITRARLRQEARVSTDAAGVFLRARRTGETTPMPQE